MAQVQQLLMQKRYTPAAVASNETAVIFRIPKGFRLVNFSAQVKTPSQASSTGTIKVGDGTTDNNVQAVQNTASGSNAAGALLIGDGAKLTTGGYLVSASGGLSVTVTYTAGTNSTAPVWEFVAIIQREWPA